MPVGRKVGGCVGWRVILVNCGRWRRMRLMRGGGRVPVFIGGRVAVVVVVVRVKWKDSVSAHTPQGRGS